MDSLSIVRVCRTKEEYHQYGGPPNTGGYWHPGNEELVFFDYSYTMKTMDEDERKRLEKAKVKLTDDDALLVLYHEALHQYIHYSCGEFSPHDWFNEGFGDYFSGAVVGDDGKVLRIDPMPWRIHTVKDMCEYGEGFVPLKEILEAERAVFYNPARIRFFYAGAWSFIYFLKTSKEAAAHPDNPTVYRADISNGTCIITNGQATLDLTCGNAPNVTVSFLAHAVQTKAQYDAGLTLLQQTATAVMSKYVDLGQ